MRHLKLSPIQTRICGGTTAEPPREVGQHPLHREDFSDGPQNKGSGFKNGEKEQVFTAKLIFTIDLFISLKMHMCVFPATAPSWN